MAGSRAWQMAPSRPCSLAWSQPCGAQAVCGRARLEAELGASGGGGAGGVSPTEGWSFRSWVPADGREGLQSCSRGAASSAHRPPSVPGLSALGRAGGGPPAAPPGDVTGAGVRDLRRAPRRSGCSALSFCVTWSPTRVCRDVLPLLWSPVLALRFPDLPSWCLECLFPDGDTEAERPVTRQTWPGHHPSLGRTVGAPACPARRGVGWDGGHL